MYSHKKKNIYICSVAQGVEDKKIWRRRRSELMKKVGEGDDRQGEVKGEREQEER